MKIKLKQTAGIIFIIVIFAVTLEIISWLLLRSGPRINHPPHFNISEWNKVKTNLQNFPERFPQIKYPALENLALKNEPPKYPMTGETTGKGLFSYSILTSNLDDIFSLRGRDSGQIKYRVRYVTDEHGRRKTSFTRDRNYASQLFFMGCSYTMGEGIEQDLIFPSLVAKKLPKTKVTNFGVAGSSPSKNLRTMTDNKKSYFKGLNRDVPAYVIYTYIDDHIRRIIGTSVSFSINPQRMSDPYYFLHKEELIYGGSFQDNFGNFRWILEKFGRTNFAHATALELPVIGSDHLELTAKILAKMKTELQGEFPELKDFIVAVYPGNNYYFHELKKYLEAEGITTLDYSQINIHHLLNGHHTLITDGHPSSLAHTFYSELILQDLLEKHGKDINPSF